MEGRLDQNIPEDTEFNDILREKGILPPLPKPKEETPPPSTESQRRDVVRKMNLGELTNEIETLEDTGGNDIDEDIKFLELYRQKRLEEMREAAIKSKFGSYCEVTKSDWTQTVNNAGKGVYVVIHLAQKGNEKCAVVDQHLRTLAPRYPMVKFLRGEVSLCVPNFPESNLPTIVIYFEGDVKTQYVGIKALGGHPCTIEDLEERLANVGAIPPTEQDESHEVSGATRSANAIRIRRGHLNRASDSDSN